MTPERIAEIRARVEAAAPGPWKWVDRDLSVGGWGHRGPDLVVVSEEESHQRHYASGATKNHKCGKEIVLESYGYDADGVLIDDADADLIANAPTDLADLLAALEAARADVARLREGIIAVAKHLDSGVDLGLSHNYSLVAAQQLEDLAATGEAQP